MATIGMRNNNRLLGVVKQTCLLRNIDHLLRADTVGVRFANARIAHTGQIISNNVVVLRQKRGDERHASGMREEPVH